MASEFSSECLHQDLEHHGHILPVGVPGIFGRGPQFEDVLQRFDELVTRIAKPFGATKMAFPPCINRSILQKSGYFESFPQLAGTVFSFTGSDAQARELSARIHADEPWGDLQTMTEVCLTPAACYPVYSTLRGTVPENGHLIDIQNWVFRHEPSVEPTRMQAFRMREFIRVGAPDDVLEWRDNWHERGLEILLSLQLPARSEVASDPFFGRVGRMLANNQKDQKLKFELTIPVISQEKPTACCSFNYHQDKFANLFEINQPNGERAHTACLGFGLERITMALFKTHGMKADSWPASVREVLWV